MFSFQHLQGIIIKLNIMLLHDVYALLCGCFVYFASCVNLTSYIKKCASVTVNRSGVIIDMLYIKPERCIARERVIILLFPVAKLLQ